MVLLKQRFLNVDLTFVYVVMLSSVFIFSVIAENVVNGNGFTWVDVEAAQWLHAHNTPILTQCLLIVTHLHDPITISLMVTLLAFFLIWEKRWHEVIAVVLVVPGGMLLNLLVKEAFKRTRPIFEQPFIILNTYSFPSGHVAATTLFYGMLTVLLISKAQTKICSALIVLIAFAMIILVAFSRLYLGAHYLSDVLGAFFEGIAWLGLCLIAVHTYCVHRGT